MEMANQSYVAPEVQGLEGGVPLEGACDAPRPLVPQATPRHMEVAQTG